jgi:pimeloyl-ACP methyl ester carboxylesterase
MSLPNASPQAVVEDFEARARRVETACGEGRMVWRAWGEGPPLLLLHGSAGSWHHFIRNIDALAAHRTVWAPDMPGCGESALPPRPDDGDSFAEVIAAGLREILGAALPVDVVGFSLGGVIGGRLAVHAPDAVRRLILIDTGGMATPARGVDTVSLRGLEGDALWAAHKHNLLAIMLHREESVDDLALHLQQTKARMGRLKPAPLVLPDKLYELLPHIRAQLDGLWGEHDWMHPGPEVHEAVLRRFQPEAVVVPIPGAGHWAMYENAPVFNAALLEMLAEPLRG